MYRCPHCRDLSISAWSQFSPPFDSKVKCPSCGVIVKVKRKLSNFLVAICLAAFSLPYLLFKFDLGLNLFYSNLILIVAGFFQIRLMEYIEIPPPKAGNP